jgi:hypothetical protein
MSCCLKKRRQIRQQQELNNLRPANAGFLITKVFHVSASDIQFIQ